MLLWIGGNTATAVVSRRSKARLSLVSFPLRACSSIRNGSGVLSVAKAASKVGGLLVVQDVQPGVVRRVLDRIVGEPGAQRTVLLFRE